MITEEELALRKEVISAWWLTLIFGELIVVPILFTQLKPVTVDGFFKGLLLLCPVAAAVIVRRHRMPAGYNPKFLALSTIAAIATIFSAVSIAFFIPFTMLTREFQGTPIENSFSMALTSIAVVVASIGLQKLMKQDPAERLRLVSNGNEALNQYNQSKDVANLTAAYDYFRLARSHEGLRKILRVELTDSISDGPEVWADSSLTFGEITAMVRSTTKVNFGYSIRSFYNTLSRKDDFNKDRFSSTLARFWLLGRLPLVDYPRKYFYESDVVAAISTIFERSLTTSEKLESLERLHRYCFLQRVSGNTPDGLYFSISDNMANRLLIYCEKLKEDDAIIADAIQEWLSLREKPNESFSFLRWMDRKT